MTVSVGDRKTSWPGDGSDPPNPLNTTFVFYENAEVFVIHESAAGVFLLLTEGVEYTLTGGAGAAGIITPDDTIVIGDTWHGFRKTAHDQGQPYASEGRFPSAAHEKVVDRAALARQDLDDDRMRSIRIPVYDDDTYADQELPPKAERISTILGFDTNGQVICVVGSIDTSLVSVTAAGQALVEFATVAEMIDYLSLFTAQGDILKAGAAGIEERLALGTLDHVLTAGASEPAWAENPKPHGHLYSLTATHSSTTLLSIDKGTCRAGSVTDSGLVNVVNTNAAFRKQFVDPSVTPWAAGDNEGGVGLGAGFAAAADDWHFFALVAQDGSAYDFGYDTDVNAANLIADAAVVTALGAACYYRRIMSFRSSATPDIPDFEQDGDLFMLSASVENDISEGDVATANRDLLAMSVPGDISVTAIFDAFVDHASATRRLYLSSPLQADETCDLTKGRCTLRMPANAVGDTGKFQIRTNTSRQIAARADGGTNTELDVALYGWIDERGRNN